VVWSRRIWCAPWLPVPSSSPWRIPIQRFPTRTPEPAGQDVIMCTGRSDYPNMVNNVLGFPFIFRGALDVHATVINEEMKLAATRALANLAKEDVPDSVCRAYGVARLEFWSRLLDSRNPLTHAFWCGSPPPSPRQRWIPESLRSP